MYADQNALPEDSADLMNPLTARLKQMLWPRHGQAAFPAEWDGRACGGRISQRFWEYHKSIEMLDLEESSVVLAIGGGSPATGISFFPRLLADAGLPVFVLDVHFGDNPTVLKTSRCFAAWPMKQPCTSC